VESVPLEVRPQDVRDLGLVLHDEHGRTPGPVLRSHGSEARALLRRGPAVVQIYVRKMESSCNAPHTDE